MRVLGLQDDLSQFVIGRDRLHPDDRAAIWARWCNVEDQKKKFGEDYYQNLVKQSKTLSSRKQISDAATIEADVSRTFDANEIKPMTIDGIENVNALEVVRRVLYAMAIHGRERNGYVQGMNYLAANFIVVTRNEETSFWLTRSVTEILLKGYFDQELYQFQVDSKAFRSLAGEMCPQLFKCLAEHDIPVDVSLARMLLCLFLQTFTKAQATKLWDSFLFAQGQTPLAAIKVALAVLKFKEESLFCGLEGTDIRVTSSNSEARQNKSTISVSSLIMKLQCNDDCQANFEKILYMAFFDYEARISSISLAKLNSHRNTDQTVARYECMSKKCIVFPNPVLSVDLSIAGSKLRSLLNRPKGAKLPRDEFEYIPPGAIVTATAVKKGWAQLIGGGWVKLRTGRSHNLQRIITCAHSPRVQARKRRNQEVSEKSASAPTAGSERSVPLGASPAKMSRSSRTGRAGKDIQLTEFGAGDASAQTAATAASQQFSRAKARSIRRLERQQVKRQQQAGNHFAAKDTKLVIRRSTTNAGLHIAAHPHFAYVCNGTQAGKVIVSVDGVPVQDISTAAELKERLLRAAYPKTIVMRKPEPVPGMSNLAMASQSHNEKIAKEALEHIRINRNIRANFKAGHISAKERDAILHKQKQAAGASLKLMRPATSAESLNEATTKTSQKARMSPLSDELMTALQHAGQFASDTLTRGLIPKGTFHQAMDILLHIQRQNVQEHGKENEELNQNDTKEYKSKRSRSRSRTRSIGAEESQFALVRGVVQQLAKAHPPEFVTL